MPPFNHTTTAAPRHVSVLHDVLRWNLKEIALLGVLQDELSACKDSRDPTGTG